MFRQNNAVLREQLCFFLSHFSVNMVGDKYDRTHIIQYILLVTLYIFDNTFNYFPHIMQMWISAVWNIIYKIHKCEVNLNL
jgi:hypothetical protein